jgi:RNA polymerase sigma factor (sigma-70 family)
MTKQNFLRVLNLDSKEDDSNNPPANPDSQLWDEFRTGSNSAFVEIYETYFEKLYAYGVRIVGDRMLVKDCIQEVFMDLQEFRHKIGPTNSIKFYLFKCLRRKLIHGIKKWEGRVQDLDSTINFEISASPEQLLIDQQINDLQRQKLNQALSRLSPRRKEIIYYFYFEGLSYQQIQEIMGLENVKTTRNLLYKALNFLKEIFD